MPSQSPFDLYLNEEPQAAYFSYQDQWKTPNQRKFFQSQFSNIQNQYMGQLGLQARGGQEPTLTLTDFLGKFPWHQRFQELSPQERGQDTSRFSPFARWLI